MVPAILHFIGFAVPRGLGSGAGMLSVGAGGRGVDWRLGAEWPLAPGWIIGLGVVLLVGLGWLYLRPGAAPEGGGFSLPRRVVLWGMRAGAMILLLGMLGQWRLDRFETDLPDLVLLFDTSRSMSLPPTDSAADADTTRWQSIIDLFSQQDAELLRRWSREYRLRPWIVGQDRQGPLLPLPSEAASLQRQLAELAPQQASSPLGDALAAAVEAQRGRSTAAIVMLSDGIVTDGLPLPEAAQRAAAERLPWIVVRTGGTEAPPQVAIAEVVAESSALVGDAVRVIARIRFSAARGEATQVRLIDQDSGRPLASERVGQGISSGLVTVPLSFLATEPGLRRLRIVVEPLGGEVAVEDNEAEASVDVRDDSFRVLLVAGGPSYEFRFLKHLLERATNRDGSRHMVELVSVLQRGDSRYAEQDRTARALPPVDSTTLEGLDLIILSDSDPAALGEVLQRRIADLVTVGGLSLVVIAGPDHLPGALTGSPLDPLLPVDPDNVRAPRSAAEPLRWHRTPLGQIAPSLRIAEGEQAWGEMPPLYWLAESRALRPGARVLLETPDGGAGDAPLPIVISQFVGNGQVWLQLTDESFRLRGADPEAQAYERYWLQLIRSLARRRSPSGENEAQLTVLGERFSASRPIPFRVRLGSTLAAAAGGAVEIAVRDQQGDSHAFQATAAGGGTYSGVIEGLDSGAYRAVLARPVGSGDPPSDAFVIQDDPLEMRTTTVDVDALRAATALTGGRTIAIEEAASKLPEAIPPGRSVRIRPLPPRMIWNHWSIALCLFGMLAGEWVLRRRWGSL